MLITSRTPLRVSFFGGGTDYPEYFNRFPGAVVGMGINRYVYVSALKLSDFIDYRFRLSYSRLERVRNVEDLEHPVVRSVLQHYAIEGPLDINIIADLPASSGLGSSSSFTVGLINLLATLRSKPMTRLELARTAIMVERDILSERVGVQDQLHAAFGGMNRFDFIDGRFSISPVQMQPEPQSQLMASLVLAYTGVTRYASEVLKGQISATAERKIDRELSHMMELTKQAVTVLEGDNPYTVVREFGALMHEGWMTKRKLADNISSPHIDELYSAAMAAGALGGKLCGAGGGGFLLMVVPPEARARFDQAMQHVTLIPIAMDLHGSTILTG
jgi:D-glycero-alpha-D-manno-heptose-7-phosphate kinase